MFHEKNLYNCLHLCNPVGVSHNLCNRVTRMVYEMIITSHSQVKHAMNRLDRITFLLTKTASLT